MRPKRLQIFRFGTLVVKLGLVAIYSGLRIRVRKAQTLSDVTNSDPGHWLSSLNKLLPYYYIELYIQDYGSGFTGLDTYGSYVSGSGTPVVKLSYRKLLYIQDSGQNTSVVMIRIRDTGFQA
jgi:hypothetical protein